MKFYELTYLISPELLKEEERTLQEKINTLIQKEKGELDKPPHQYIGSGDKVIEPVKRKLGYPLKKKEGAYLVTINFQLDPDRLANIEKILKSENQILRYIILNKKFKKPIEVLKKPVKKPRVPPIKPIKKPKEKVELKEIEKKLEEILEGS